MTLHVRFTSYVQNSKILSRQFTPHISCMNASSMNIKCSLIKSSKKGCLLFMFFVPFMKKGLGCIRRRFLGSKFVTNHLQSVSKSYRKVIFVSKTKTIEDKNKNENENDYKSIFCGNPTIGWGSVILKAFFLMLFCSKWTKWIICKWCDECFTVSWLLNQMPSSRSYFRHLEASINRINKQLFSCWIITDQFFLLILLMLHNIQN